MAAPQTPGVNPVVSGVGTSIVRTVVPLVLALIVRAGAKAGLNLDPGLFLDTVTVVVTTLYYAVVRLLESRVAPAWGWLLGVAKVPAYPTMSNTTTQAAAQNPVNVEVQPEGAGDNLPPTS